MHLNQARFDWQINAVPNDDPRIEQLRKAGLNFSPAFLRLCLSRGLTTKEAIESATDQAPQLFHDPFLMHDMQRAVDRLEQAIADQERVVIYGDYDADGITSTLILYEGLESLGANVFYYLPNRKDDGYGPNKDRYQQLIEEEQVNLILTCDNGVAGFEALDYAKSQGIDVIVTDHHEIQEKLPEAYAIVHPSHPEASYPFEDLSGAGVALKLITALTGDISPDAVELAAIGTVADMVSLTDENRTIVLAGLNTMVNTSRIGLRLLLLDAKVDQTSISTQTIGFIIGPRLNAVGRLGDPTPGLELLATFDEERATELVTEINQVNDKRKNIVETIMGEIEQRVQDYETLPDIIIESSSFWQAGVLGIAASRIVKKYNRPVILFQYQKETDSYKGSGRSVSNVNLFEWLTQVKDCLHYFGGHSQAAGMTVKASEWDQFKETMLEVGHQYHEAILQPESLTIDLDLSTSEVTQEFIEETEKLGPFGQENIQPLVVISNAAIEQFRLIGKDQQHVKMSLNSDKTSLDTIGFSMADQCQFMEAGQTVSVVGHLDLNEWKNIVKPQLMLEDVGISGNQWIDVRGNRIPNQLISLDEALFVFDHTSLSNAYADQLHLSSSAVTYKQLRDIELADYQRLVIMEPPKEVEPLKQLINNNQWTQIYLGSYIQESKYMAGLPTRDETSNLFKWLRPQEPFVIRDQLTNMSQQLNIHQTKLKLLLVMYLQAEFVTIKDGWISNVEELPQHKVNMTELDAYKQYVVAMEVEQLLNYQSIDSIKAYFEGK